MFEYRFIVHNQQWTGYQQAVHIIEIVQGGKFSLAFLLFFFYWKHYFGNIKL